MLKNKQKTQFASPKGKYKAAETIDKKRGSYRWLKICKNEMTSQQRSVCK